MFRSDLLPIRIGDRLSVALPMCNCPFGAGTKLRCSSNSKEHQKITENIATCIKGLRLLCEDGDGKAQEAYDLMKDCRAHDLREAISILEDQALWAGKLSEIGDRHHASDDESVFDVLTRAAAAGDEEAKALIACGLFDQKVY